MNVSLPYGTGSIDIEVPDGSTVIEPVHVTGLPDERAAALRSFRHPIGAPPLREAVRAGARVAIVISDVTRPLPSRRILPWVLEELGHVPRGNITVIVGCGTHRACTAAELEELAGEEVYRTVRCVNHDAFDPAGLAVAGLLRDGTEVLLNRSYVEADTRVTIGFIEPHFFAGFSGGPKAVMPGIAGIGTIMRFHAAAMIGHPRAAWGVLDGNPVYGMAKEAALLTKPDFSINVTLNRNREITGFYSGDVIAAHRAGTEAAGPLSLFPCEGPFDIVLTSNGGYPLDRNLYQAVKGISAAAAVVREKGAIICAARCADGVPDHGDFSSILGMGRGPRELLDLIHDPGFSRMDQWQVQKLAEALMRADVYLQSGLPDDTVRRALCVPCRDAGETLASLLKQKPGARVAVLREGPLAVPQCNSYHGGLL